MLLLVFKSAFHFDIGAKRKSQFIYFCAVSLYCMYLLTLSTLVDKNPIFEGKKKSLVEFLLVCDYIKNIWLEHSQKREFLSRVFVVNRKASGIFF